jgi:hypothetical protein
MSNWITVADSVKARERAVDVERERIVAILNITVGEYLAEKRLIEAAVVSNVIAQIKAGNK